MSSAAAAVRKRVIIFIAYVRRNVIYGELLRGYGAITCRRVAAVAGPA